MATKVERKKFDFDNDRWIRNHFATIVDKFGGKYVFIAKGRIFPVKPNQDVRKLEEKIRKKYGAPTGMPVPQPEDFHSVLFRGQLTK